MRAMKRAMTVLRALSEHGVGIDPALQQGEGEPGSEIRQDALEGRRGPNNQIVGIRSSRIMSRDVV